jgi:hypothetical protein
LVGFGNQRKARLGRGDDVPIDRVREATGWDLRVADAVTETEPPTAEELAALAALREAR